MSRIVVSGHVGNDERISCYTMVSRVDNIAFTNAMII